MRKKPDKKKVLQEVEMLFKEAGEVFSTSPDQANKLIHKARRATMKRRIRLPATLKRQFCKHCFAYLKHGKNARVRIHDGKVIIHCSSCRKYTRIPLHTKRVTTKK